MHLRQSNRALNLHLREGWFREYQVLDSRTHPLMTMHGASGYVLTGITFFGHS